MRAVFDTSTIISLLLSRRETSGWLLTLWKSGKFEVVVSRQLFLELEHVLKRPHIVRRIDLSRQLALLRRLRREGIWTPGIAETTGTTPDPKDDFLLSAALETGAQFIITWDDALLKTKEVMGVTFVSPNDFISIILQNE